MLEDLSGLWTGALSQVYIGAGIMLLFTVISLWTPYTQSTNWYRDPVLFSCGSSKRVTIQSEQITIFIH